MVDGRRRQTCARTPSSTYRSTRFDRVHVDDDDDVSSAVRVSRAASRRWRYERTRRRPRERTNDIHDGRGVDAGSSPRLMRACARVNDARSGCGETRKVRERVTDGIRFDSDAGARESTTRGRRGTTTTRAANGTAMKVSGEDEGRRDAMSRMRCGKTCARVLLMLMMVTCARGIDRSMCE